MRYDSPPAFLMAFVAAIPLGIGVLLVLAPAHAQPPPATAAPISDGFVRLGVGALGGLGPAVGDPAHPPSCNGQSWLMYLPENADAMDCDNEGEGWGVSYVDGGLVDGWVLTIQEAYPNSPPAAASYAPAVQTGPAAWPALDGFSANATSAESRTRVGALAVVQHFHPSVVQGLYRDDITLMNRGPREIANLTYRRVMEWKDPTTSSDMTNITIAVPPGADMPSSLQFSNPNYMGQSDPQAPTVSPGAGCCAAAWPPASRYASLNYGDFGTTMQFNLGALRSGHARNFTLFYGGAHNASRSLAEIQQAGIELYAQVLVPEGGAWRNAPGWWENSTFQCTQTYYATHVGCSYQYHNDTYTCPMDATCTQDTWVCCNTHWVPASELPALLMGFAGNLSRDVDRPPIADFRAACGAGGMQFSGLASHDPDPGDTIVAWQWDFGDGQTGSGATRAHLYVPPGDHLVRLTVTEATGLTGTVAHDVSLDCPPDLDPIPDRAVEVGFALPTTCLRAADPDDASAALLWHLQGLPLGATWDVHHCVHFTPGAGEVHDFPVTVAACDQHSCATQTFWIDVWAPPDPMHAAACQDSDHDGICDAADNCPGVANHDQRDSLGNGIGDACRSVAATRRVANVASAHGPSDLDRDGIPDAADNCPVTPNHDQSDLDGDGIGDVCDDDMDGDGIPNWAPDPHAVLDNCPRVPNPDQRDTNGDGIGDACENATAPALRAARPAGALVALPGAGPWGAAVPWAAAVALALWAWLRPGALVVLFTRLSGADVRAHPTRARIVARIEAEPGIRYAALVKSLRLARGIAEHHLRVLIAAHAVIADLREGPRRFYAPGDVPATAGPPSVLHSQRARGIMDEVDRHPGASLAHIARALGAPSTKVSYHARRLAAAGHLRLERDGRRVRVYPHSHPGHRP
ncbi:MAG: thrombospondin type 3 repeat-containing protein [Thermoplasmatota archaeon]